MLGANGKIRISPSKLISWKDCPRLFKSAMEGERTNSIHSCIGNAAHYVMEQINKGVPLDADQRDKLMEERLFLECRKHGVGMKFNKAFESSLVTVKKYKPPADRLFLNAEAKRVIEFDNFVISYIIDAQWTNLEDTQLIITDYKTSFKVPSTPLQLLVYGVCEVERLKRAGVSLPDNSITGEFHMLRDGKVYTYPMSNKLIHDTREWLFQQVEMMLSLHKLDTSEDPKWKGKAFPEIPGNGCHFCPRLECPNKTSGY